MGNIIHAQQTLRIGLPITEWLNIGAAMGEAIEEVIGDAIGGAIGVAISGPIGDAISGVNGSPHGAAI